MTVAVVSLGITQITAWGTSYYCLGVLAGPIVQDTGWSRGFVFLAFTVALLATGIVSSVGEGRRTPAPSGRRSPFPVPGQEELAVAEPSPGAPNPRVGGRSRASAAGR